MMRWRLILAVSLVFTSLGTAQADADGGGWPLWQVDGERNRVYLLGSVHLLRPQDYPLPEALYEAYADAEAIYMEIDIDDLDPLEAATIAQELGLATDNEGLARLLGPEAFAEAQALAAAANVPLERLGRTEPWFASITVEQMLLVRAGFDPELGIETHFATRAAEDGKPIEGLETLREQLGILDGLPLDAQRELLLQTLEDAPEVGAFMDRMLSAWRKGDMTTLDAVVLDEMREHPQLYTALVVDRNRRWVRQLEELLDDDEDYLVVVGALHLVGPDGVPALMTEAGARVTRLGN